MLILFVVFIPRHFQQTTLDDFVFHMTYLSPITVVLLSKRKLLSPLDCVSAIDTKLMKSCSIMNLAWILKLGQQFESFQCICKPEFSIVIKNHEIALIMVEILPNEVLQISQAIPVWYPNSFDCLRSESPFVVACSIAILAFTTKGVLQLVRF